jgi:hypothetical protein
MEISIMGIGTKEKWMGKVATITHLKTIFIKVAFKMESSLEKEPYFTAIP